MKAYRIMFQTEPPIWLHKLLKSFAGLLTGKAYLYEMKVRFLDNNSVIEVTDEIGLVNYMRENSFGRELNNSEYMLNYAKRAVINANHDIRATSEKEFIEDLKALNHIQIIY